MVELNCCWFLYGVWITSGFTNVGFFYLLTNFDMIYYIFSPIFIFFFICYSFACLQFCYCQIFTCSDCYWFLPVLIVTDFYMLCNLLLTFRLTKMMTFCHMTEVKSCWVWNFPRPSSHLWCLSLDVWSWPLVILMDILTPMSNCK